MRQIFVAGKTELSRDLLERKLYIVRKVIENRIRQTAAQGICSRRGCSIWRRYPQKRWCTKACSCRYRFGGYFADLQDSRISSAIALVHSRFSTNTFPSWDLAQPFRLIAHNGEINTIKGNRFWMQTSESGFQSQLFGDDIQKILPVIEPGKSDSASFDNALELLVMTGRSLPHALMMLIPESFNKLNPIPDDLKYFYEYHSAFMEPWDGPASMVFCDGRFVGGTLDRNGLRPSRYVVTKDDLIVMGSEVGVQTFAPEQIDYKGPPDARQTAAGRYARKGASSRIGDQGADQPPEALPRMGGDVTASRLADIHVKGPVPVGMSDEQLHEMQLLFGYSREDIENIIIPMVDDQPGAGRLDGNRYAAGGFLR